LLNPFSGVHKELTHDYPGIYTDYPQPVWGDFRYSVTVYDPFLSRVVYPEYRGIVLWDLEADKFIARFTTRDYWGGIPKWSPDGQQFVMKIDEDVPGTIKSGMSYIASPGMGKRLD